MKVNELITQLHKFPADAKVVIWYDGFCIEAEGTYLTNTGRVLINKENGYIYDEEDAGVGWEYKTCRWEPCVS